MCAMSEGWIKLHRQMEQWEWYTDPNTCHLFMHLLFRANHKPKRWRGVDIATGQLITSYGNLAEQTGLSVRNVRTCLSHLQQTGEVTCTSTNKFTLIAIANYSKYQVPETPRQAKRQATDKPTDKQPTTNKNGKKLKNEKNTVWIEIENWFTKMSIGNPEAYLRRMISSSTELAVRKAWGEVKRGSVDPTPAEMFARAKHYAKTKR